jgi:hypothetical protein
MAINSGRIAAGPTNTRTTAKINCVNIASTAPPGERKYVDPSTGNVVTDQQLPQREGQVLVYSTQNDTALYVVVDISGTLTWKRCAAITGYIDSTTGKPFGL